MHHHRLGQIVASSDFLEAVPRSALIAAIVSHARQGYVQSEHEHDGKRFRLETDEERRKTDVRLA